MTFTAVKLVRVPIFASIGKAITKKNADNGKSARRPPTDRPTTDRSPATKIAIPLWAFSPRGKKEEFAEMQ